MNSVLRAACHIAAGLLVVSCRPDPDLSRAVSAGAPPRIEPDYTSLVIPPNIAPLNFRIEEEGEEYAVRISGDAGSPFELRCPDGMCRIDARFWREMLRENAGKRIYWDVFAKTQGEGWVRFDRITHAVSRDSIDPYIVYRRLEPNRQVAAIKGIFQRNLEGFGRSPLVTLRDGTFYCVNCHTFHQHDPDRFFFHIRGDHAGMMLVADGRMRKIDTRQAPLSRPLAYAAWHPDGRHIAGTMNMYIGYFPSTSRRYYSRTFEKRGDLAVYDVERNALSTTCSVFGDEYIETHPFWSADGRHIYFVRGRDVPLLSHTDLDKFKFDLMRIAYDTRTGIWGDPETVAAFAEAGKSCSFPCPSPDGQYVVHILADRGTYPITEESSDVYLFDLVSRQDRRLDAVDSDLSESFPRWSSNGRWLSFLSNRGDGRSALPYFAYFDTEGQAHKAFVLPQEDPAYYDTFTDTYNVLELVKSRVEVDPFELARAMQEPAVGVNFPHPPQVDAYTGATRKWAASRGAEGP